jgi:hypothetical protein
MANSIWQATAQTETGNIIAGAQVTVVNEDTGVNATIYSSIGGAALTNPFFANAEGFIQFYAGAGTYRVTAEDTGTGQSITWRYIRFGDSASRDSGILTGQLPTAEDLSMVGATENFTSNNLNPNVFGGLNATDTLATGFAENTTTVSLLLPISSLTAPSSITVVGSFSLIDSEYNTLNANVTSFNLSVRSSNKVVLIGGVSGLSGLTKSEIVQLISNTSASKITVNF